MKVTATIINNRAKDILLDGKWYKTGQPIEIDLANALRFQRLFELKIDVSARGKYDASLFNNNKTYVFVGDADTTSGFGNCTVNLLKYSVQDGYDVRWVGRNNQVKELNKIGMLPFSENMGVVYHEQPKESWFTSPFGKRLAIVPFETTRIPPSWVMRINSLDALMVISDQNEQMMRDSGITVPIEKIQWGVDKKKWDYTPRIDDGVFTFGQCGALSERKGTDLLVKAFIAAFPQWQFPKVRLLLKSSYNIFKWGAKNDQRVKVVLNPMDFTEFKKQFWDKVDAFVFPSRGEGWGLPAHEAMAQGIPTMVTNWGGLSEFTTENTAILLNDYKYVHADNFKELYKEDCGDWVEPSLDELVEKMRWIYFHQDEAKEIGKRAHDYIYKNFLWEHVMPNYYKAIDKYFKK